MKPKQILNPEHIAKASTRNVPVSTKHCVEISSHLRYKTTELAKSILEEVVELKRAIPFKKFNKDMGHKPGMAAGRYPKKAAQEVLNLIHSVEANAQFKGLNTSALKIIKILANKASIPATGGRKRTGTKRTHLEIEVKEIKLRKKERTKKSATKDTKDTKVTKETPQTQEIKPVENKIEELKEDKQEEKTEAVEEKVEEQPVKETETETPVEEEVKEVKEETKGEQKK
jgi:large subunit ribosomal protein L22